MVDILLENGYVRVIKGKHGYFLYNTNDRFVGKSLEAYGEWCEPELELLLKVLEPGDQVFDVGANIGTHTVPFAKKVGNRGLVHALEPQRLVFQALCGNVSLNRLLNVVCLNKGAGKDQGIVKVPVLDPAVEQNFSAMNIEGFSQGDSIEVVTIDTLEPNRCKLIKIDVEGMEADVLDGAEITIKRLQPILFIENNSEDNSPNIIQRILELNYQAWWLIARYYNSSNYFGNLENIFAPYHPEANLFCLPRGTDGPVDGLEPVCGADDTWKLALERIINKGNW